MRSAWHSVRRRYPGGASSAAVGGGGLRAGVCDECRVRFEDADLLLRAGCRHDPVDGQPTDAEVDLGAVVHIDMSEIGSAFAVDVAGVGGCELRLSQRFPAAAAGRGRGGGAVAVGEVEADGSESYGDR